LKGQLKPSLQPPFKLVGCIPAVQKINAMILARDDRQNNNPERMPTYRRNNVPTIAKLLYDDEAEVDDDYSNEDEHEEDDEGSVYTPGLLDEADDYGVHDPMLHIRYNNMHASSPVMVRGKRKLDVPDSTMPRLQLGLGSMLLKDDLPLRSFPPVMVVPSTAQKTAVIAKGTVKLFVLILLLTILYSL